MFTKILLPFLFLSLLNSNVFSQVMYSNTTYTSRFNPGLGSKGTPVVAYDDVTIPSAFTNGSDSVSITKIKVGIRRAPNAPATNVNLYYTTYEVNPRGATVPGETAHVFLGKVSLPVNGGSLVTTVISLGDSVSALFKIKNDANTAQNASQKFLIGASFDNPSSGNGIILSNETHNHDSSIWIDNADNDKTLYATSFRRNLSASYYLEIFGKSTNTQTKEDRNLLSDVAVNNIAKTAKQDK